MASGNWIGIAWTSVAILNLPVQMLAQGRQPVINAIVNAASYVSGPVSPGEMVTIFGTGLGPSQFVHLQLNSEGRISTTLAGVTVSFDGVLAPLIYVSATQVTAMVPYEMISYPIASVQVNYGAGTSTVLSIPIAQTAPGIFSAGATGQGNAAANNSGGSLNSPNNPAQPGSYITFYLTGEGPTSPPGIDGNIATGTFNITSLVTVTIGGVQAQVPYAGAAPGNTNGFTQVNAIVPASLQYGGALPLVIQIGNAFSQSGLTIAVTGPVAPSSPAAPTNLQAISVSPTTIDLGWLNNDLAATAIRVEMQTASTGTFQDIGTAASLTETVVSGLQPNTLYNFRVRAQQGTSYSAYSNVASATTLPQSLAAPSNLQAVATSSTTANLTWVNNAPTATAVRIEIQTGGTGAFADIGAAATLTGTGIANLSPNTFYTFRVRAEQGNEYSDYSNTASLTTSAQQGSQRAVVLIHGIGESSSDMQDLQQSLQATLDPAKFFVNASFDYSDCTKTILCANTCTIGGGAQRLAAQLQSSIAPGHIILVGYSLGGLIARDLLLNNYGSILSSHPVDALITLGTPNLGYPWESFDNTLFCPVLVQQMSGNYRDPRGFVWSSYLNSLNEQWISTPLPGGSIPWLAVAGTQCADAFRWTDFGLEPDPNTGCRDANPNNDNVVCEDSALFNLSSANLSGLNTPTESLYAPQYAHTTGNLLGNLVVRSLFTGCDWTTPGTESLSDPQSDLLPYLVNFINSH